MSLEHKCLRKLGKIILYTHASLTQKWCILYSHFINVTITYVCVIIVVCVCLRLLMWHATYFLYEPLPLLHIFYKWLMWASTYIMAWIKLWLAWTLTNLKRKGKKECSGLQNCYTCRFLMCLSMPRPCFNLLTLLVLPWDYRLFIGVGCML